MKKFLITLSGARPEILARCPTEQAKFEGIGGAVLTTSVLAFVSMTFALNSALEVSIFLAIPASLIWALAIMSLDRWLVGTMQADGPRRWRLALPRVIMAVLLGLAISTPLVLQIFNAEIEAQIVEIKQERANSFADQQAEGTVGQNVARLRKNVSSLQKVVASNGDVPLDPARDPKIKALTKERNAQQAQATKHYNEWQCQLYGGDRCPRKGDGVLAQASKRAYDKAKARVDLINGQIEDRKAELADTDEGAKQIRLATAKSELPKAQDELDAALRAQRDLQAAFDAENRASDGLLIRLQALNEVSGQDITLRTAHILLFLLFLLIECLPVAVKLMQRSGNYEKVLAVAANHELRNARDSIAPQFGARPSPQAENGPTTVWDIWTPRAEQPEPVIPDSFKPEPTPTMTVPPPRPHTEPTPTMPDEGENRGSLDDELLREMSDTRTIRKPGPDTSRSGEFELFPDET
ncbi:DUF4407 domain-containing protein [Streptosporangium sp. KLBMP 9127]|nr:DUF4407 domain-containing protein [Streptosporangium sp. KLBMP 9127]